MQNYIGNGAVLFRAAICGVASVVAAYPGVVIAQETAAAPSDDGGIVLAEIIVTAERRSENLQRVALDIDVVTPEDVARQNVVSALDVGRTANGISIGQVGSFTQVYIRGVGTSSSNMFGDPTVTFNQDGVVIDRPNGVGPIFYDIERIEVLKGPQGTLYGRNSTGGAVNVLSRAPTFERGGYVSGTLGNYESRDVQAAVNLPLGDTLAIRASGQLTGRESHLKGGFPNDGYRDAVTRAARLQALWKPTPDLSIRLIGEYGYDDRAGDNNVVLAPNEPGTNKWLGQANPVANANLLAAAPPGTIALRSDDSRALRKLWNVTGELNWNPGFATFTLIPAYRDIRTTSVAYDTGVRLGYDEHDRQTTIEGRLANQTEAYRWVVGAFYFRDRRPASNLATANIFFLNANSEFSRIDNDSWAGFADGGLSLTPTLRLLGGIRYTHERKEIEGLRTDLDFNPTNNFPINNAKTFTAVTWRGGAEYDVAPDSMLFATVSRGFKSGGFFTASSGNEYAPERLTAYTLGMRNRLFDRRVTLNFDAFYWKYNDNQQSFQGFTPSGELAFVTYNAGNARLFGATVDLTARATVHDTFNLSGEYVDSKYSEFKYIAPGLISIFNPARTGCATSQPFAAGPGPLPKVSVDCSGFPLPRAPKLRVRGNYDHEFEFSNGSTLTFSATGTYASRQYLTIDYLPEGRVGSTFTTDLDLTFRTPSKNISISAFVNNLTNEAVYSGGGEHQLAAKTFYAVIGPPRTWGVRGRFDF